MTAFEMTPEEAREYFCQKADEYHKAGDIENMDKMLDQLNELNVTLKFTEQVTDHG